jgi:GST-like protein
MLELSSFPIHAKWPAKHPEHLQLYSLPTPNGVKVSILLEETGLAYEPTSRPMTRCRPSSCR